MLKTILTLFIFSCLVANDARLIASFEKNAVITIEEIINFENLEKKTLKSLKLEDGKLNISLPLTKTTAIIISGHDTKSTITEHTIYLEKGGIYTLSEHTDMVRKYRVTKEENSQINTVWDAILDDYFQTMPISLPECATTKYWQDYSAKQIKKTQCKKGVCFRTYDHIPICSCRTKISCEKCWPFRRF